MLRSQLRIFSLVLFTALFCSTSAYCQTVSLTHSNFLNTTTIGIGSNASIVLFSESSSEDSNLPAVDSLDFSITVLDVDFSGSSIVAPTVTNISGLGIFSGATASFTPANLSASSNAEGVLSIPNSTALIDNAPVAEIFFDTTGLSEGDTFLYGFSGDFVNGNERFETFSALTFFGTAVSVPEPSSAGFILALGGVAMLRRKRA